MYMKKSTVKKKVKVTLLMALTADGFTARNSSEFVSWTSGEDKKFFAETSKKAGAVIMGKNTFDTFDGSLNDRLNIVMTSKKIKGDENTIYYSGTPENLLMDLEKKGYNEVVLGGGPYTNQTFLEKGLIDFIIITISPLLFGKGLSMFKESLDSKLELIDVWKLDKETVAIKYLLRKEEN